MNQAVVDGISRSYLKSRTAVKEVSRSWSEYWSWTAVDICNGLIHLRSRPIFHSENTKIEELFYFRSCSLLWFTVRNSTLLYPFAPSTSKLKSNGKTVTLLKLIILKKTTFCRHSFCRGIWQTEQSTVDGNRLLRWFSILTVIPQQQKS